MQEHEMHAEWIDVDRDTLLQLINHLDKNIVPVGTTSLRTIESLYWIGCKMLEKLSIDFDGIAVSQWDPYELKGNATTTEALQAIIDWLQINGYQKLLTRTQILIAPGYTFRIIKGLVTNFHQPQSTLLLLVAALIGKDWRTIYDHALRHDYRFLSYGDGCLLLQ
jgi:S-adenosylmethionine:tRNA ribosyltransferase-isomerase